MIPVGGRLTHFPAVISELAHLRDGSVDELGRLSDALDPLPAISLRHHELEAAALAVPANLVLELFIAAVKQPNHAIALALLAPSRQAAKVAAPMSPAAGFKITLTGIRFINASMGDFEQNASLKIGHRRAGRICGAMPPPRYTPPVESVVNARFPAAAPYADTNISSV